MTWDSQLMDNKPDPKGFRRAVIFLVGGTLILIGLIATTTWALVSKDPTLPIAFFFILLGIGLVGYKML